ncbi:MAG TPA: acyltransferase [Actinomycetota bacterium]
MSDVFVHPTAVVDEGASIGAGTRIWHFAHVMSGAVIGADVSIGQNVFVADGVRIGDGCKIQNNVSVYEGVELDEGVFCGPGMVFTNVRFPRALYPTANDEYAKTFVERGATIGAHATIVCGTRLGAWSFVAAGAVVVADIPAFALVAGVPARRIGWVCECGRPVKLHGGYGVCTVCGRAVRLIDEDTLEQVSP